MSIAEQINMMVIQLPTDEQQLVYELIRRINPYDILTAEDIADIEEARAEFERGDTVNHNNINWD